MMIFRVGDAAFGRRDFVNVNCNIINACKPKTGRRDDTVCCIGQVFRCKFSTSPQNGCPAGSYCRNSPALQVSCTDITMTATSGSTLAAYAGNYIIQDSSWDGFPIYQNWGKNTVLTYEKTNSRWVILDKSTFNDIVSGAYDQNNAAYKPLGSNGNLSPLQGWGAYFTVSTPSPKKGVYCPGSAARSLVEGSYLYYSTPYFRMCAQGYYCPLPTIQIACTNLLVSTRSDTSAEAPKSSLLGEYVLRSDTVNGFPVYYKSGWILSYRTSGKWGFSQYVDGNPLSAVSGTSGSVFQTAASTDPKANWGGYSVGYSDNGPGLACDAGTKIPGMR